jgi:hypothetical protein
VTVAPTYESCPDSEVVHDLVTGLFWEQQSVGGGTGFIDASDHCDDLNLLQLGGFTDWRLPHLRELVSLLDYGLNNPSMAPQFALEGNFFWSADFKQGDNYWGVNYSSGSAVWWGDPTGADGRCVRGDVQSSFVEQSETIIDSSLDLEWDKATAGPFDWTGAISHCNGLTQPPGGGWRLPTAKELMTIYIPGADGGSFPPGFTHDLQSYWSSTPDPNGAQMALTVNFSSPSILQGAAGRRGIDQTYDAVCLRTPQ